MKSLILLGYGKMARALALGLKDKVHLQVAGRNPQKIREFCNDLQLTPLLQKDNLIEVQDQEILLCVKPYALQSFQFVGKAKCVYSILNATTLEILRSKIQSEGFIRAMPNVAASVGKSITSLCGDEAYKQRAFEIFNAIGKSVWIEEKTMAVAAALGGCAPAFLAIVAESLMDAGVTNGLTRNESKEIVEGLFEGFGALLQTTHPTLLKESVMSPGGSTAQGVASLEKNALRNAFFEAVMASKNFA
ncbi:pyrroline-5-carboxylate reductase [Helicobacter canadensis]|uniref:Pyrroline-5-carboxylate reductase n=1 Tax=Helicobacter canadensis MIT 98-5491 TaxID=537970 RepID=C5ZYP6_9HELI|nr:pyrroline-5-carboxylate reductase [Helicobacter canadensis]EES89154.1 pyrroline-5-carboxylate reductase [Helicobacter canadensis MIT 98-5491]EFR47935.1 putative pyrroline-5-carboxylate reductase [Helicobacter canadensis MIT 98-5491]STO99187.1 pyrroline-5-carboxylate reductase [Helicobacter canadensis]